jgi:hypothetical protein
MTSSEQAEILITARLLQAAQRIFWLPAGITPLVAAAVIFGTKSTAAGAAIVFGLVGSAYAIRIAFDARLFEDIATGRLETSDLDIALRAFGKHTQNRSWANRCRGARRLIVLCIGAAVAQILTVIGIP